MRDEAKTKEELISELIQLRQSVAELKRLKNDCKRTELALRESEERFRTFMDNTPATAWIKDEQGRYVYLNKTFEELHDVRLEDWQGRTDFEVWPFEIAGEFQKSDLAVLAAGQLIQNIEETTNPDGRRSYWWKLKFPIQDTSGKRYVGGIGMDITHRKQMEEELLKSRDELELRVRERTAELERANDQLRLIPAKLISVQEEERRRLASELHDSIGQTLAALKFGIETVLVKKERGDSAGAFKLLKRFIPTLQTSIDETRAIYMGLRPTMLDGLGLLATLEWLCREFQSSYPSYHLELETRIEEEEIPEILKLPMYRITQEALNNVVKHSGAQWVHLLVAKNGDSIELFIQDDGEGFDLESILAQDAGRSLGLVGMRERAELTGGRLSIESTLDKGTTVRVLWPMEAESTAK